jgi:hypothetical protein
LLLQLQSNGTRDIITPWDSFNNSFPFARSLPLPLRVPLPVLYSLLVPGPFLSTLRVLLTVAVVIVIAIARMAPSTARPTRICPDVIIMFLVKYLIPS